MGSSSSTLTAKFLAQLVENVVRRDAILVDVCCSFFAVSNERVPTLGLFIKTIGKGKGDGVGQLNGVYGINILVPSDEAQGSLNPLLFVADYGNNRIQV